MKELGISIKIWEGLAETGEGRDGKERIAKRYGEFVAFCPLCELYNRDRKHYCNGCPYFEEFGHCDTGGRPYDKWTSSKEGDRKQHARDFLAQLLYLEHKLEKDDITNQKPERPAPKFKVGARVVVMCSPDVTGMDWQVGTEATIVSFTWRQNRWSYDIRHSQTDDIYAARENWLELAPEWEDVTMECKIELHKSKDGDGGYFYDILHKGHWLIDGGLGEPQVKDNKIDVECDGYKVETGGKSYSKFNYFRIMKRV